MTIPVDTANALTPTARDWADLDVLETALFKVERLHVRATPEYREWLTCMVRNVRGLMGVNVNKPHLSPAILAIMFLAKPIRTGGFRERSRGRGWQPKKARNR